MLTKRTGFIVVIVLLSCLMFVGAVLADSTTVVVTEEDVARQAENTPPTDNWVIYTRAAGAAAFGAGPDLPPAGIGSLEMITPTGADKVFIFNFDHVGTPLADIDAISYATYRDSGDSLNQVPSINVQVDYNGAAAGGFTTLVFEPVYNTNQGAIIEDTWQTWDAFASGSAVWWSTQPINGVCSFTCYVSWDTIVTNNPDAVIMGGFGVNQGSGNPALYAATDALTLGVNGNSTTYDFEPYRAASSKDECKNGGWQSLRRADSTFFANQGDCIQYVNTDQ